MTREEALKVLEMFLHKQCDLERTKFAYDQNTVWKAVNMANEALEQEPCEDAISRQAVIDALHSKFSDGFNSDKWWNSMAVLYAINRTPSVKPQEPKTGHWIDDTRLGYHVSVCSNCGWRGHGDTCLIYKPKYCPNCGAKMVDLQESEDKE